MTRESINEIEVSKIANVLQSELDKYKESIKKISNLDKLKLEEDALMGEMKKFEDQLKLTEYNIPENVDYDNVRYTKQEIADKIIELINKNEVEYQYTLGLYQLVNMWQDVKEITHIDYYKYDSTLRVLGQLRFKGYKEWRDILIINKFFEGCHEQYVRDTSFNIYLSQKHNAIMDNMQEITGEDPATGEKKSPSKANKAKKK